MGKAVYLVDKNGLVPVIQKKVMQKRPADHGMFPDAEMKLFRYFTAKLRHMNTVVVHRLSAMLYKFMIFIVRSADDKLIEHISHIGPDVFSVFHMANYAPSTLYLQGYFIKNLVFHAYFL